MNSKFQNSSLLMVQIIVLTMAAVTLGLLAIVKTAITIVSSFGNVTTTLSVLKIYALMIKKKKECRYFHFIEVFFHSATQAYSEKD